jgi:hypothetical protein
VPLGFRISAHSLRKQLAYRGISDHADGLLLRLLLLLLLLLLLPLLLLAACPHS